MYIESFIVRYIGTLLDSNFINLRFINSLTVYLISKTQDPNYGYVRYSAVIYNGATNQVSIKNNNKKINIIQIQYIGALVSCRPIGWSGNGGGGGY